VGFGGRPRIGNPQAGLFYPVVWLAWISKWPAALGWITLGHLLLGGIGTYILARRSGISGAGAAAAAACYQASPYGLAQVFEGHYPHVWAASWYPWAFWAADGLRLGDWPRALALPAVLALALLTGHPQEAYYLSITLVIWMCIGLFKDARAGAWRDGLVRATTTVAALVLALGLTALEWVPDIQAQAWVLRSSRMPLPEASRYHINLLNLLQLLSPNALGRPADYFGHDNYWESVVSIGWVSLVLAMVGVWRSPMRRAVKGWAALACGALLFAAGWRFGLFALFYQVIPGMDRFRVPARALFLAQLGGSMLAGLGADSIARPAHGQLEDWTSCWRQYRLWVAVILAGLLVGQIVAWRAGLDGDPYGNLPHLRASRRVPQPNRERERDRWVIACARLTHDPAFWTVVAGTTIGLCWVQRRPHERLGVALALGGLAMAELAWHGHAILKTAPVSKFAGPDPIGETLARLTNAGPVRIRARDAYYGDLWAVRYGFDKTNIYDAFQIEHAAKVYEPLYWLFGPERPAVLSGMMGGPVIRNRREVRQAVLDRMNVGFLVSDRPVDWGGWPVEASGFWNGSSYWIYRNPSALPRAYVVPNAAIVAADLANPGIFRLVAPREAVLLPFDPIITAGRRQVFTPAHYEANVPDCVIVSVRTSAPGLLVVADTWMPGWTAELDGRAAPIMRGNLAQRVIALPRAGDHRVILRYRAPGFAVGLAISAASAFVWGGLLTCCLMRTLVRRRALVPVKRAWALETTFLILDRQGEMAR
jgi:hypothetical protein